MTKQEQSDKIKKVMIDYLTKTIKYPHCTDEQVMQHLKPMWIKLEENNLTGGLNFKAFQEHANNQFMMAQVKSMMGI